MSYLLESDRPHLVQALADARRNGRQINSLQGFEPLVHEDDAMSVMLDVAQVLGWPRAGWKIAATNAELQCRLRTTQPVCGIIYKRDLQSTPALLPHVSLLDPVIECEFFFEFGKPLPFRLEPYTDGEVADAVAAVRIGIEVAQCRFPRKQLPGPLYILADGFAAGHYVSGPKLSDWRQSLSYGVDVGLERNGQIVARGTSGDVMGNPLNAVVWLCERLRKLGQGLHHGDVVASGSCNILVPGRVGDDFRAIFSDIGDVHLRLY